MTFFRDFKRYIIYLDKSAPSKWITSKKKLRLLVSILNAFVYHAMHVQADKWLGESLTKIREFVKAATVILNGAAPGVGYYQTLMNDLVHISSLLPLRMGFDGCIGGTRFDHWTRAKMSLFATSLLTWDGSEKTFVRKPSQSDVSTAINRMGTSGSTNTYGANLGDLFGVRIDAMCESVIGGSLAPTILTAAKCLRNLQEKYVVVPLNPVVVKLNTSYPGASDYVSPVELNRRNPCTPLSTPRGGPPKKYQECTLVYLPQSVPTPFKDGVQILAA